MQKIIAPKGVQRISEFMSEFPNGILNKKETGVGATHLAITNNQPYIICVPTIELIENKTYQHSNLFGVFGGIKKTDFDNYLASEKIPKLMVTYNSLPKLVTWLKNPYSDFKLLVDEYHSLLSDYSYRDEAIDGLLEEALKFEHKCFVSATPINPKYCPEQLKEIDNYEIEWETSSKIKPFRKRTNKPFAAVVNVIKRFKANGNKLRMNINGKLEESKECYFFINSVKAIVDILNSANLTGKEVKIICSDTERNKELLKDWSISKVSDENKPFTFITSKAFLGADFYSNSGIVYVVSSVHKKNTLYDIATDIFQIAGRIRTKENPFRNIIFHIYNTGASDMSKEEFLNWVEQKEADTNLTIQGFNKLSIEEQKASLKRYELDMNDDYVYYNKKTNLLEYNTLKQLNEEFEFSIVNETYLSGLTIRDAYYKAGFDVSENQIYEEIVMEFIEEATSMSFKSILKEYVDLIDCRDNIECIEDKEEIKRLEILEPSIKDIVKQIGTQRVRTLGYNVKAMKNNMFSNSVEFKNLVKSKIDNVFEEGKIYTSSYVKEQLQLIYNLEEVNKKAKATDLFEYYQVNKKYRFINNKTTDSVEILNKNKFSFTN
jgi:hypothetical protein